MPKSPFPADACNGAKGEPSFVVAPTLSLEWELDHISVVHLMNQVERAGGHVLTGVLRGKS